jgi:hypothetical protein
MMDTTDSVPRLVGPRRAGLGFALILGMAVGLQPAASAQPADRVSRKCTKQAAIYRSLDGRLCRNFRVFRRSRTAADRAWRGAVTSVPRFGRLRLSQSRRPPGRRGLERDLLIVPTREHHGLCIVQRSGGSSFVSCTRIGRVLERGIWNLAVCSDKQPDNTFILFMVLPDDVRSPRLTTVDGTEFRPAIRQNRILAALPRRDEGDVLEKITWRTQQGTKTERFKLPSDIGDDDCAPNQSR